MSKENSIQMPGPLIEVEKVSFLLGVSKALVYRMAERGQIPCVRWECPGEGTQKPRTMVKFKLEDINKFIEEHYVPARM